MKYIYFHRITESQNGRGWKGPLVQPSCQSRVTYSRLHRTFSRRVLNISREKDSTIPLGSPFQCSVTLRGKKFFLMFSWNFLCFNLCPLPLVLSLGTTGKSLAPSSWPPPCRYLEAFLRSPQPSLLQAEQAQLPQPLLTGHEWWCVSCKEGSAGDCLTWRAPAADPDALGNLFTRPVCLPPERLHIGRS